MDVGGALSLPLWGKVAPQGRMRGRCAIAARLRTAVGKFPLISQRAGPLTASPKGEAAQWSGPLTEWLLQHKKGRAFALP